MNKRFTRRVGNIAHGTATVAYAAARGAFLKLMSWNVWGMATVFKAQNAQWHKYLNNAWYNLGGTPSKLQNTINKAYNRKPIGLKLAPKEIKDIYTRAGQPINEGIGAEPVTITILGTQITLSSAVIVAIKTILILAYNYYRNKKRLPQEDENYFNDDPNFPDDNNYSWLNTGGGEGGEEEEEDNTTKILLAAAAAYLLFRE